jgi:hypothetical protein
MATFYVRQGDTFNPRFYLCDRDGIAVDPTGMVFTFRVIATYGSEAVTLERTSEDDGVVVEYDEDRKMYYAQPIVSAEHTAALPATRYQHEFKVTDSQGNTGTAAIGTLCIEREINR